MDGKRTADALSEILRILGELDPEDQTRVLQTAATFFSLSLRAQSSNYLPNLDRLDLSSPVPVPFSGRDGMSPKEFLLQKRPTSEVQRIACLAFYLAHYREMPHFESGDIRDLNIEAAQQRISNLPRSISHAVEAGQLVAAGNGKRQLSAFGEQFVLALPDQAVAAQVMAQRKAKSKGVRPSSSRQPLEAAKKRMRVDEA